MVNIGKNKTASPKIIILQLKSHFAKYSFEIVLAQKPKLNQFQKETKPYQTGHMLFREHENNPKKIIKMATEKHNLIALVYKKQI